MFTGHRVRVWPHDVLPAFEFIWKPLVCSGPQGSPELHALITVATSTGDHNLDAQSKVY